MSNLANKLMKMVGKTWNRRVSKKMYLTQSNKRKEVVVSHDCTRSKEKQYIEKTCVNGSQKCLKHSKNINIAKS